MLILETQKREKGADLHALRNQGMIPAVFYGPGHESVSISVPLKEFNKILTAAGESTIITLKTEEGDKDVLIQSVDSHPVSGDALHVDFYLFDKNQTVEVPVELVFEGVSPAVKEKGGILVKVLHELNIKALPMNLPQHINVDISSLVDMDSTINAKDIVLPAGVTLAEDPEEVVASIAEPKEEEEAPVADISTVEVAKKGKKEEEAPAE